jgi:hypothetical protein
MLVPIAIVSVIGYGTYRAFKRPRIVGMTAKRMKIFQSAVVTLKDPEKLRILAQSYEDNGCIAEARVLRQRAALRELPKETKLQRRLVFSRAIRSSNIEGVRKAAAAFAGEGAMGAAANLRRHAESLVLEAEMLQVFTEPLNDFASDDDDDSGKSSTEDASVDETSDESTEEEVVDDEDSADDEDVVEEVVKAVDNSEGQQEVDERESSDEQPPPDGEHAAIPESPQVAAT